MFLGLAKSFKGCKVNVVVGNEYVRAMPGGGGGVLPYMGHISMCRCEGYGFHAVYSSIGYKNQSFWV